MIKFVPTDEMDGGTVVCTGSHPHWPEQKNKTYPMVVHCMLYIITGTKLFSKFRNVGDHVHQLFVPTWNSHSFLSKKSVFESRV